MANAATGTKKAPAKSKEVELAKGRPVRTLDANEVTVVTKGHPLANVLYYKRNDNKYLPTDQTVIEFKAKTQLQPAGVFPYTNPETNQQELVVFFGNQRVLKCRAAGMPVSVTYFADYTVDDAAAANIAENAAREDLSAIDLLQAVVRSVERHKRIGTKNVFQVVAQEFNQGSHQWARDQYKIAQLPKPIIKALAAGTINNTTAIQITREENDEEKLKLFETLKGDESNTKLGKKGAVKVKDAISARKGDGTPKDTLTSKEWRVIAADPKVDVEFRTLIQAVLGDIDIKEAQRAGLDFVIHPVMPTKGKGKGGTPKESGPAVDITNLQFDDEDEEFEDDDEVEEDEDE